MRASSVFLIVMGLFGAIALVPWAHAKEVTGKVVAVYHEPVTVNSKVLDKVSVTVAPCANPNQFETFGYSPGGLSDDNSLGYIFNHLANAARSTVQKNQYMNSVSGHATFQVSDQNVVQKTTFWGYNWECGQDLDRAGGGGSAQGGYSAPAGGGASSGGTKPASPTTPGLGGLKNLRKLGF